MQRIEIDGARFEDIDGTALEIRAGSPPVTMSNAIFKNVTGTAMIIGSNDAKVTDLSTAGMNPWHERWAAVAAGRVMLETVGPIVSQIFR